MTAMIMVGLAVLPLLVVASGAFRAHTESQWAEGILERILKGPTETIYKGYGDLNWQDRVFLDLDPEILDAITERPREFVSVLVSHLDDPRPTRFLALTRSSASPVQLGYIALDLLTVMTHDDRVKMRSMAGKKANFGVKEEFYFEPLAFQCKDDGWIATPEVRDVRKNWERLCDTGGLKVDTEDLEKLAEWKRSHSQRGR